MSGQGIRIILPIGVLKCILYVLVGMVLMGMRTAGSGHDRKEKSNAQSLCWIQRTVRMQKWRANSAPHHAAARSTTCPRLKKKKKISAPCHFHKFLFFPFFFFFVQQTSGGKQSTHRQRRRGLASRRDGAVNSNALTATITAVNKTNPLPPPKKCASSLSATPRRSTTSPASSTQARKKNSINPRSA